MSKFLKNTRNFQKISKFQNHQKIFLMDDVRVQIIIQVLICFQINKSDITRQPKRPILSHSQGWKSTFNHVIIWSNVKDYVLENAKTWSVLFRNRINYDLPVLFELKYLIVLILYCIITNVVEIESEHD